MKKFMTTWIIAALVAAFVGYVYFYEYKGAEQRLEQEQLEKRVVSIDPNKIAKVTIVKGKNRFVLAKQAGTWKIMEPVQDLADQDKLLDWTDDLVKESYQTTVTEEGQAYDDKVYGFDAPLGEVDLEIEAQEPVKVLLGSRPAFGEAVYLRTNNNKRVLLGNRTWRDLLITRLFDLRDKMIMRWPTAKIDRLRIELKGSRPFTLVNKDGNWQMAENSDWILDQNRVKDLVRAVQELKANDVVDEDKDSAGAKKEYRGQKVKLKVTASLATSEGAKDWEMELSGPKDSKVFVTTSGQPVVYQVNETDLNKLMNSAAYYRNRELPFAIDTAPVTRLVVEQPPTSFNIVKSKEQWELEPADGNKLVDQSLAVDLLERIRNLRASDFPDKKGKLTESNSIQLLDKDGKQLYRMAWGELRKAGGKDSKIEQYWVETSLETTPFVVDAASIRNLPIERIVKPKAKATDSPATGSVNTKAKKDETKLGSGTHK